VLIFRLNKRKNKRKALILSVLLIFLYLCGVVKVESIKFQIKDFTDGFSYSDQRNKPISAIIIHHDGSNDTVSIKGMADFHTFTRGWKTVSYHYYIYKDRIYQLHRHSDLTAHAVDWNNKSIAICVHGDFTKTDVPFGTYLRVAIVAQMLASEYGIDPSMVLRHKDVNETECTGTMNINYIRFLMKVVKYF
jgi:hypothetical protein